MYVDRVYNVHDSHFALSFDSTVFYIFYCKFAQIMPLSLEMFLRRVRITVR